MYVYIKWFYCKLTWSLYLINLLNGTKPRRLSMTNIAETWNSSGIVMDIFTLVIDDILIW